MAKIQGLGLDKLCEALGVERPNEVTRVVVDIRAGHVPMLYVERIGDANKILAALREPGIELRREDPADSALREVGDLRAAANQLRVVAGELRRDAPAREVLHARDGAHWQRNRCGAQGGAATDDEQATCPECRAAIEHEKSARRPHQGTSTGGPVVHGNVTQRS